MIERGLPYHWEESIATCSNFRVPVLLLVLLVVGAATRVSGAGVRLMLKFLMPSPTMDSEKATRMALVAAPVIGPAAVYAKLRTYMLPMGLCTRK